MITNLRLSPDKQTIRWENGKQSVALALGYEARPHLLAYLNEVLVLRETWGAGERTITIYHADGTVKAHPALPKLRHAVGGIYSIWYEQGKRKQTVVLLTEEFSPYETACDFDLETHEFSNFHPTK